MNRRQGITFEVDDPHMVDADDGVSRVACRVRLPDKLNLERAVQVAGCAIDRFAPFTRKITVRCPTQRAASERGFDVIVESSGIANPLAELADLFDGLGERVVCAISQDFGLAPFAR